MVTHDPNLANRAERNIHLIDGRVSGEEFVRSQEEIPQAIKLNGCEPIAAHI
jgi:ABC-type lipoprotein export system ATPase subunit